MDLGTHPVASSIRRTHIVLWMTEGFLSCPGLSLNSAVRPADIFRWLANPTLPDMTNFLNRCALVAMVAVLFAGCSAEATKNKHLERASAFLKTGEFDKAEIECLNVLKLDAENLQAMEHLGEIWLERGAPLRALPFLVRVRASVPGNREVQRRVMQLSLELGKLADARREALAILQRTPDDKAAIVVLSRAARSREDLERVERALTKADRSSASYHLASANLQMRRGDAKAAAAALQRAQALEPKSPLVKLAQAAHHLGLGNSAQAGVEFKAAAELAPLRSTEKIRYAEYLTQTGSVESAKALLDDITAKAPDYLPAWRGRAYIALAEKKNDEATLLLEKIFARDPGNYEARMARAQLRHAKGERAAAIEELEALGKQFPAMAEDKFLLGQLLLQGGDAARARLALRSAVTQNPDHVDAVLLLARINLAAGDAGAVAESMTELLANQPNSLPGQMLMLEAMRAMGRLEEAAEGIRTRIKAAPERVELHRLLGLVLIQLQKPDEARRSLERSLELTPGFTPIVAELVGLDLKEKKFVDAMKRVQVEMKRTPDTVAVRFLEGRVFAAEGRWDEAEAALVKVIDADPTFTAAYDLLANAFVARSQSPQALARLDEFVAKRAGNLQASLLAGRVHTELKQFGKARELFENYLTAHPETPVVLNNLAYLYAEHLGDSNRGLELARRARALDGNSPEIADTLGWILYRRKEFAEAVSLFRESVNKAPANGEFQYHLGLASQQLGQTDVARAAFERAARSGGTFTGKDQIAKRLAELPAPPATHSPAPAGSPKAN